jgi:DNA-binding NarL/FixJ family response regulator
MKARVLLVDDHAIFTEGLRTLLESEFSVVGAAQDGRAALRLVRDLKPDVVIMDISMPQLNGIDALRKIRKLDRRVKIVILTMHNEITYVREALEAGASAYVLKQSPAVDLRLAVQKALRGQTYVPAVVANEFLPDTRASRLTKKRPSLLTLRQREVLQLLAEGRSAKEVASILNVSPRTIEFHKYQLMKQLDLRNMTLLLRFAIKHRIIRE